MYKWFLPSLTEVLTQAGADNFENVSTDLAGKGENLPPKRVNQSRIKRAQREWCGAIAALESLLAKDFEDMQSAGQIRSLQGFILCGPVPVLSQPALVTRMNACIFTPETKKTLASLPSGEILKSQTNKITIENDFSNYPKSHLHQSLSLLPGDSLAAEQFCLVLTCGFSLVMVLGEDVNGNSCFQFSFVPELVHKAWLALRSRVMLTSPDRVEQLDTLFFQFSPISPHYKIVMQFSQLLLKYLPEPLEEPDNKIITENNLISNTKSTVENNLISNAKSQIPNSADIELLQAIAHEVRTPLATIRTLTRLLLKRKNLDIDIIKRLEMIDRECSEQIDRFGLIFRAAELETSGQDASHLHLTATSLAQVLQQSIPRWQKQASRRNLSLDIDLPQKMPAVVSDPQMLDQVLTGLIENFSCSLPSGSRLEVQVMLAGSQLKLQLQSNSNVKSDLQASVPELKSIGHLLMFQPETGNLSLNISVTKNLFQALGGKLIVRQRPQKGEVMTIFLPLTEF